MTAAKKKAGSAPKHHPGRQRPVAGKVKRAPSRRRQTMRRKPEDEKTPDIRQKVDRGASVSALPVIARKAPTARPAEHLHLPPGRVQQARHPLLVLAIVAASLGLLVGALWVVSSSGLVTNRFKPELESELSKALGRVVTVNRLEGGLFDRVVLRQVRIATPQQPDTLAITIKQVVVQYSLWDILVRKRPLADSLHQIELIHPLIEIERLPDGRWRSPAWALTAKPALVAGPATPGTELPKIRISLVAGEIRLRHGSQTASVYNLKGLLNLRDPYASRLYLSGRTERRRLQNVRISGFFNWPEQEIRLGIEAKRVALRPFERVAQLSDYFEIHEGEADLEVHYASRPPATAQPPLSDLTGKLVLYDTTVRTPLIPEPIKSVYGVATLANGRITLKSLQALLGTMQWSARGTVEEWARPRLNITVQSENLDLHDLSATFPKLVPFDSEGSGVAAIRIQGQVPDLSVTASFNLDKGRIGPLPIRKFETISRYQDNELRLLLARGVVAQGWIEGRGWIRFPASGDEVPQVNFRGEARDIFLGDIGPMIGLNGLAGRADGVLNLRGDARQPVLSVTAYVPKLALGTQIYHQVKGELEFGSGVLQIGARTRLGPLSDARLAVRAKQYPTGWVLHDLTLTQQGRERASARGSWSLSTPTPFTGRVQADQLPVQAIPFLPVALRHLNGWINFAGQVDGRRDAPRIQGSFDTPRLTQSRGRAIDAHGDFTLEPAGLELRQVRLDRGRLRIQGRLGFGRLDPVTGGVTLAAIPFNTLLDLVRLPKGSAKTSGRVSGQIDISGRLAELQSQGRLALQDLRWDDFAVKTGVVDFSSSGRRFWIKKVELTQPQGSFNATGEMDWRQSTGPFRLLAWTEGFRVGSRRWTGELKIEGAFAPENNLRRYTAAVSLDKFSINQKPMPDLEGRLSLSGQTLTLEDLQWGVAMTGRGYYSWARPARGEVQLALTDSNLEPWRLLIDPAQKPLEQKISGTLQCGLSEGRVQASLHVTAGNQDLKAETSGRLVKTGLGVYSGEVKFRQFSSPLLFDLFFLAEPKHAPEGKVSGQVRFEGEGTMLKSLTSELEYGDFRFGEWRFKRLKTAGEWGPSGLKLKTLDGQQARGSLHLISGSLDRTPEGGFNVTLGLAADQFQFFSRIFHGTYQVTGRLNPRGPAPDLKVDVRCPDFQLNLRPFGEFRASVHYHGQQLAIRTPEGNPYRLSADLVLPPDGSVIIQEISLGVGAHEYVHGEGRVDGQGTSRLLFKARDVQADMITRTLGWPQPWSGNVNGTILYSDAGHIPFFKIDLKVDNGSVLHLPFDVLYGTVLIDHDWLYFKGSEDAVMLKQHGKYTMRLTGRLPLPQTKAAAERMEGEEMDVRLSMPEGDLSFLTFVPYIASASGSSSLDLAIRGTMEYPSLSGRATIRNGRVAPRLYAPLVENIQADLIFEENKTTIRRLEGKVNQGVLRVSAGPQAPWAMIFRRLAPDQINLKLDIRDRIRLDTTPDFEWISAWATGQLLLAGTLDAPVIGGKLELSDGQFTYPSRPLTEFTREMKGGSTSYQQLHLTARRNLWFYNDVVRAQIAPDQSVHLTGGRNDFSGEGRITVNKGTLTYLDTDFTLDPNEETAVVFQGREKPRLLSLAKTTIRNVSIKDEGRLRDAVIYLRVTGELGALKISLDSDPPMSQAQIVSLLTLGEDFSNWSQQDIDQKVQSAGARILGRWAGNLIGREIGKEIKKITPLDVIDIRFGGVEKLADTIMSGNGTTGTAAGTSLLKDTQIDVGKYLTDDLFLNYRGILKDRAEEQGGGLAWQSYLGMEYNIDSSKKIKVYKNFDADSEQELFWGIEGRMQFKGWSPVEFEESQRAAEMEKVTPPAKTQPSPVK